MNSLLIPFILFTFIIIGFRNSFIGNLNRIILMVWGKELHFHFYLIIIQIKCFQIEYSGIPKNFRISNITYNQRRFYIEFNKIISWRIGVIFFIFKNNFIKSKTAITSKGYVFIIIPEGIKQSR